MDNGQLLDMAVKGSAILNSARKINKVMNICRIFSLVAFGIAVALNVVGVINTIRQ